MPVGCLDDCRLLRSVVEGFVRRSDLWSFQSLINISVAATNGIGESLTLTSVCPRMTFL
jgi:hypothetical protein